MKYVIVYTEARVNDDYDTAQLTALTVGSMREIAEADVVILCGKDRARVVKSRSTDPTEDIVTEIATSASRTT